MSSDGESTVVRMSKNNRRILVRRTLIAAFILICVACAYSFFLVFQFHSTVAAFQKQNANFLVAYQNDQGKTVHGSYGAIPGPFFIPAPLVRYHRSIYSMHLGHQPGSNPEEIDELFRLLPQLSQLEGLLLEGFLIDPERAAAITRLPELKYLTLMACQIEKSCLASLLQSQGLAYVNLVDAEFDEAELETLLLSPTQETLLALTLSNCKITDTTATVLSRCRNLELLELDGTQITDQGLKMLARLPQLKVLILDHTKVTDTGVAYLSSTPNLVELSLSNTSVSDALLETLKQDIPALRVSDD
ncbi:hypothetical protein [uncultured Gimesia sp.]|uniref:hypothetical protein n=1 Tax=uncultured Gimesia sp. TaxID=1678688 RepID=UPI0030DADA88|tara:strand:- start:16182 stop:17090 length:909 start_codon:yes stop_codon:yes gene_type:complete